MTFTFVELFGGIGGGSLGMQRAGMTPVAFVEIDPFCQAVLREHHPGVPIFGDVHDVGARNLPPCDLIAGGFPCQPVSQAGQRRG